MSAPVLVSASNIEQKTHVSEEILRQWRLNFGFPLPVHGSNGRRGYSQEQVDQIVLIRQLLELGIKPSVIVGQPLGHLECLFASLQSKGSEEEFSAEIRNAIALVENGQFENLMAHLQAQRAYRSLSEFVEQIAGPFMEAVGEAWALGRIAVYQEHLCTDIMSRLLSAELTRLQNASDGTRILFASPIHELHALGNLMARCVLADHGANCIGLGSPMSNADIVRAVNAWQAEIVALSFSFSYPSEKLRPLLENLAELLPLDMKIWVGGAGARVLIPQPLHRVEVFSDLQAPVLALKA